MKRKEFIAFSGVAGMSMAFRKAFGKITAEDNTSGKRAEKAEITYEKIHLELFHPWTITRGTAAYKENVLVYYKKDGIIGVGEAGHMTAAGQNADRTIRELLPLIPLYRDTDPFLFYELPDKAREIVPGLSPAKAALDIALMDWIGKKLTIPIYQFLGVDPKSEVKTSFSIGRDKPEVMRQEVKETTPYGILKVKITGRGDQEAIRAIRSMTDKPIRVDVNEGWKDKEKAIKEIEWLAAQGVEFVEQPMPVEMLEETRWLKERSPIPIVADEAVNTSEDVLKIADAYDGINIKLMKSGGITEAYRMTLLARLLKLDIMLGCMIETSVGIAAAVQLQALARWVDLDGNLLIKNDPYTGLTLREGQWVMSGKPGIGVRKTGNT
ncbi:MAG: dipeptide epimerase [Bacteroidales bacterium]|nr:dipeptide epimerase [Bacteroidales bacterium]